MERINVTHSTGEYTIYAGEGILGDALGGFFAANRYDRICVVSDSNVWPLHGETLTAALSAAGVSAADVNVFPAGETSKCISTVVKMYETFTKASLTRHSLVIAFGGGVCGDMAGFAAATYLRGIDVVQIPTTLLSQIDSSIGGKTGVDLAAGKNLVGAFKQPRAVIADADFLKTLPQRYLNDGMGEAIKYGCIADPELFYSIGAKTIGMGDIIARCMKIKAKYVMEDEFEKGVRIHLNFGHTFGHAVEKLGGYKRYSHGEAVGIGMLIAAQLSWRFGYPLYYKEIKNTLEAWSLPTVNDYSGSDMMKVVASDKKRVGDEISLVLLEDLGKPVVHKVPIYQLIELIV